MPSETDEITVFVCGGGPCKHVWNGPVVDLEDGYTHGQTVTCSLCGAWAINVSMLEGV